jgi:hypothetical protein
MADLITHRPRRSSRGTIPVRMVAATAVFALAGLVAGACTAAASGPTAGGPIVSAPAASPVASSSPPASGTSGAPCVSATDPTAVCSEPSASPSTAPTAAPASPGEPSASPAEQAASGTTVVTAAQNGTTLHLAVGERFELKLGSDMKWAPKVENPSIVAPVAGAGLAPGVQGVYVAKAAGTTTLTAVGSPSCAAGSICPQFRVLFTLTISVS